jgi:hypothetical protein
MTSRRSDGGATFVALIATGSPVRAAFEEAEAVPPFGLTLLRNEVPHFWQQLEKFF